jgi:hypothetical protein
MMKKYFKFKSVAIFILPIVYFACTTTKHMPSENYVPNEETAIKIAEAIWYPIYGSKIENSKPYKAHMKDSLVWIVEGTLPKGVKGGVPYIEINKKDCKILNVTHGK